MPDTDKSEAMLVNQPKLSCPFVICIHIKWNVGLNDETLDVFTGVYAKEGSELYQSLYAIYFRN